MVEWRQCVEDLRYEVSDAGTVRMIGKTEARKPSVTPKGYGLIVTWNPAKKKYVGTYVHLMVLSAFVGPRPVGMQGSHLNGDNGDNRLANLAYETPTANHARKRAHGTDFSGARNPMAKLLPSDVAAIRLSAESNSALGARYGVAQSTIGRIRRNEAWVAA